MVITVLKAIFIIGIIVMMVYAVRHFYFAYNRMFGRQRLYYNDVISSEMPFISILIPMHNEEKVLKNVLDSLLQCDYDRDRMEIIPINDHSSDKTRSMLEEYHSQYEFIRPLHRKSDERGKPAGLNDAIQISEGDVIIVFDADYRPSQNMLKQLAVAFLDPEIGSVMGRVVPYNTNVNILTRLLNLERSGGYQSDQQARYNLRTIPQYGGTVGGFLKHVMVESGGFNTAVLAEDTELTFRLYLRGWKVIYANSAECYEEVPETWAVRAKQVRRWSRGHNRVTFRYWLPVLFSDNMYFREKIDGILLLFVYMVPFILAVSILVSLSLFFTGEMNVLAGWWVLLFIGAYNSFGNFAPFYEISTALIMDGVKKDVMLLPLLTFNFYFYLWNISLGFLDAIVDMFTRRNVKWDKTARFATLDQEKQEEQVKETA
jgi:cellulose synthase/poly-beta-1,6-N-acetylglucosamine synthase-like glycosyltransferase